MENIIFKALVGSHAYGTNVEGSDFDVKGVFIQSPEDVLIHGYQQQQIVNKDETYYEIRRFIELCCTGNPTMLELLYIPEDCIIYKHPIWDELIKHRDKFLSKSCRHSFCGYAYEQIKKAGGLQKKMNWEKSRVERKTPLDFCYVYEEGKSLPIERWLSRENKHQAFCGLVAIEHFKDCYALYYDYNSHYGREANRPYEPLGFRGIVEEYSTEVRLSSVPKGITPEGIICYNKDAYTTHCKDYKEYQTWLDNRNVQRYVDTETHGQKIDGKNLLHCYRLLETGIEIAKLKTINVRRPNAEFLIGIRKGKYDLTKLLNEAEGKMQELNKAFDECDLPDKADRGFLMSLLVKIRRKYYGK